MIHKIAKRVRICREYTQRVYSMGIWCETRLASYTLYGLVLCDAAQMRANDNYRVHISSRLARVMCVCGCYVWSNYDDDIGVS